MAITLTQDQLDELLSTIESLSSMMEPYYKQNGGANEADALVERYRAEHFPFHEVIPNKPFICPECSALKHNEHSLSMHLLNVHGWSSRRRRNFLAGLLGGTRVWASKEEYLQSKSVPV